MSKYINIVNRAERFAYINLAILILFSLKIYPRWFMPGGSYQIIFLATTTLSLIMLNPVIEKAGYKMRMLFFIILYAVFFNLPISHEFRPGYFMDSLIFIELLLLPISIFYNAYELLRKLFYYISIFAIVLWCIHTIGFDLPNIAIRREDLGGELHQTYYIYGPVISLFSDNSKSLERVCGLFAEPGHFGIYLSLMMAINKFRFNHREDFIMLIAGLLTFSTAFYGIIGLGMIYKFFFLSKYNDFKILFPVFLIATSILVSSTSIQEVLIGRVVEGRHVSSINDLVENRVVNTTKSNYERIMRTDKKWFGEGMTDTDQVQETNWRGGVYRYGIIGISVFILLVLNIVSIVPLKYKLLILSITTLIMSHRIYQLFYTGIPYLLYAASLLNSDDYIDEAITEDDSFIEA